MSVEWRERQRIVLRERESKSFLLPWSSSLPLNESRQALRPRRMRFEYPDLSVPQADSVQLSLPSLVRRNLTLKVNLVCTKVESLGTAVLEFTLGNLLC